MKIEKSSNDVVDYRIRTAVTVFNTRDNFSFQLVFYGAWPVPQRQVFHCLEERGFDSDFYEVLENRLLDSGFDHSAGRGRRRDYGASVADAPQVKYFYTAGLGRHDEIKLAETRSGRIRR